MRIAEACVVVELQFEGIHEDGFSNSGVELGVLIQSKDDLPGGGYAWCASTSDATASYLDLGDIWPSYSASVGVHRDAFAKRGWLHQHPIRGGFGFWCLDGDTWPDHEFLVTKVVYDNNSSMEVKTIEGNTSPGDGGSQSDGGGCYQRDRILTAGRVTFGVVPGDIDDAKVEAAVDHIRKLRGMRPLTNAEKRAAGVPTSQPPDEALYWLWLRWNLGEGEFRKYGPRSIHRPSVLPRVIPKRWIRRADTFIAKRKKR